MTKNTCIASLNQSYQSFADINGAIDYRLYFLVYIDA